MAYEFRQKRIPYGRPGHLVRGEDNRHTVCVAFILSDRLSITAGWGHFGTIANDHEDGVWGLEVKYESWVRKGPASAPPGNRHRLSP